MGRVLDVKTIRSVFHVIYWNLNSWHYLTWPVETHLFTYVWWHLRGTFSNYFWWLTKRWYRSRKVSYPMECWWLVQIREPILFRTVAPIPHGGITTKSPNVVMWTKHWIQNSVPPEHWRWNRILTLVQTETQSTYWKRRSWRFWHYWKFCTGE
jgi:hypothetical protein